MAKKSNAHPDCTVLYFGNNTQQVFYNDTSPRSGPSTWDAFSQTCVELWAATHTSKESGTRESIFALEKTRHGPRAMELHELIKEIGAVPELSGCNLELLQKSYNSLSLADVAQVVSYAGIENHIHYPACADIFREALATALYHKKDKSLIDATAYAHTRAAKNTFVPG